MKFNVRHVLVTLLTAVTASTASAYSGLYIFGDSLSDSGNNALAIGSNGGQVVSSNVYIPSQPYASDQYTNGNVWAYSFASAIGLSSFALPSLAGGGNFAFGGARTSTDGAAPYYFPPSLITQKNMYLTATSGNADSTALYVVAGGGNDARDAITNAVGAFMGGGLGAMNAAISTAANQYAIGTKSIVDSLQAAGAQDIVVWNVPNLGLAPAVTSDPMAPTSSFIGSLVASAMNSSMAQVMLGETGVTLFDAYGLLTNAVTNPAAYGLTNVTSACGVAPATCSTALFWDGIHPTAAGHAMLADAMIQTLNITPVPEPETYAMLVAGLALVGGIARRRKVALH